MLYIHEDKINNAKCCQIGFITKLEVWVAANPLFSSDLIDDDLILALNSLWSRLFLNWVAVGLILTMTKYLIVVLNENYMVSKHHHPKIKTEAYHPSNDISFN